MKHLGKSLILMSALGAASASAQNQPATPGQQPITPARPAPSATDNRAAQAVKNVFTEWQLQELPAAVQRTVREQAGNLKIEDIDREDRTGQTVWEVEFEREGQNIEIHIADDGKLLPDERPAARVAAEAERASRTPGVGTPATRETGRKMGASMKWEELPKAVQDKALAWGQKEMLADIDREEKNGKTAYEIEFRREGRNLEMLFSEEGNLLESNDPSARPTAQGAPPAGVSESVPKPQPPPPIDNPEKSEKPQN